MEVDLESRKRKQDGASSGVSPTLKKVNSSPDFQALMQGNRSFSSDVASVFDNQSFIDKVTPSLNTIMMPFIKLAINEAVTKAVTRLETDVIKPLQDQNKSLRLKVTESEEIIATKNELLAQKNEVISLLQKNVENLVDKVDDIEQYGRRTSIRMYNVKCDQAADCVDTVVSVINNNLNVEICAEDIERCHPLGKPNKNNIKPIIVKFKSYKTKNMVYKSKKGLKGNPEKIFITEDLTKRNHSMVSTLLTKVKAKLIHSFWTIDGKIFYKLSDTDTPERVFRNADILTPLPVDEQTAESVPTPGSI